MEKQDLSKITTKLKNQLLHSFISSTAYSLSFEIGGPHIVVTEYKDSHSIFKRKSKYKFKQKYFKTDILGNISFFTDSYWFLSIDNNEICNADYNHDKIVNILSFVLNGHSITLIKHSDEGNIIIFFSNNMRLEVKNKDGEIGTIALFFKDSFTYELGNNYLFKKYIS